MAGRAIPVFISVPSCSAQENSRKLHTSGCTSVDKEFLAGRMRSLCRQFNLQSFPASPECGNSMRDCVIGLVFLKFQGVYTGTLTGMTSESRAM
jgi:hypothetical protein